MTKKLTLTPTQKLGKRIDLVEGHLTAVDTELRGIRQLFKELRQEFSQSMHTGSWEAMFRCEREEVLRLRSQVKSMPIDPEWFDQWCLRMQTEVIDRLVPCLAGPLTDDEQVLIEKFRSELKKGLT